VSLDTTGFDVHQVNAKPGDSVTFTNNAVLTEDVRFEDEADPRCGLLFMNCTRDFTNTGVFRFYDAAHTGCGSYDACDPAFRGVVSVYGSPSVALSPATSSTMRGGLVTFQAAAATNPAGGTLAYEWDLNGDGSYETTSNSAQTVTYPTAGSFAVRVLVADPAGNQATSAASVEVVIPDSDHDGLNDDLDKCPAEAGTGSDGCVVVVPNPIATAATAGRSLGLHGALRSGVNVIVKCSDACTAFLTLTRGGSAVAAPVRATLLGAGSKLVTLRFTSSAKRRLAKLKATRLQLQVVVTDALTRVQTRKSTISLKPVKRLGKVPAVGISDNQPATFADPNFQVLRLRYARLVTPWNSVFTEPDRLDEWLQAARVHGIRPLVSFEHSRGQQCPGRHCKGPSAGQFRRAWNAFHKKYPWVKDISPWNEVNSATQPTGTKPALAASYYNVVRASCRGCTIVAADLLDASNIRRYVGAFLKKARGKPRLWGLHNYTDTNRFRSRGTKALLQTVKGTVWLTETGGVVRFVTQKGKVALPKSESRARRAMEYMFRLAEANAKRIKRIYVYQWKVNNPFDRFDAGVVRPDGKPRPSYDVLSVNASVARKR
jgi:hypothetical protein